MSYDTSLSYTNPYDISIFYVYDILTFKVTHFAIFIANILSNLEE